ncbi:MAG: hypothetical protein ABSD67_23405 [Terracidiphilus sp.]|jgi:hypothetical protein
MNAGTAGSQDAEEAERARTMSPGAAIAVESKGDLVIFSAATGTVDRSAVLADKGLAVLDVVSAKDEDVCSMPAT